MSRVLLLPLLRLCAPANLAAQQVVFTTNAHISANDLTYENRDVVVRGATLTVDGRHAFRSLTIERNATNLPGVVTHTANVVTGTLQGLELTVSNDLVVQGASGASVASRIDVTGCGSPVMQGPGTSPSGRGAAGGAGHGGQGGRGGRDGGPCYGSATFPTEFGSGAGSNWSTNPGPGGGALRLMVWGTLRVDGAIVASGADGQPGCGGGSGGSVLIVTASLAGSGRIAAGGGGTDPSGGGGGGGGRIAIYAMGGAFTGTVDAAGGTGDERGGAGTVFTMPIPGAYGLMVVDNAGHDGAITEFRNAFWSGSSPFALEVRGAARAHPYEPIALVSLSVRGGGVLSHDAGQNLFDLYVLGDATIAADGAIDASGNGHGVASGPGASPSRTGTNAGATGGAGHGGRGGDSARAGGAPYGDAIAPRELGSGSGSTYVSHEEAGSGGGAIRLTVGGTLTVDGRVEADGTDSTGGAGYGGGGSGGSIHLTVGSLAGRGRITADGGDSGGQGGGGGGSTSFAGVLESIGGLGGQVGGAGTVFTQRRSSVGELVLANAGRAGAPTELRGAFWPGAAPFALTVDQGARAHAMEPVELASLVVRGAGVMSHDAERDTFDVHVIGDATIARDGSVDVDRRGWGIARGPGRSPSRTGTSAGSTGGAGHGGRGGDAARAGGPAYGDPRAPVEMGSGAGSPYVAYEDPGAGGGAVKLFVDGTLQIDGDIRAAGGHSTGGAGYGGGGSGGSVFLSAGRLFGRGHVAVPGGDGRTVGGGGGGGGRVAIYWRIANGFAGSIDVAGGSGSSAGGTGSLHVGQGYPSAPTVLRNGDFELGDLGYWSVSGGGANAAVGSFDVTGLGATSAFGVDADATPCVLVQTLHLEGGRTYRISAELAAENTGAVADTGGDWTILVDHRPVASGGIASVAAGAVARRSACAVFVPSRSGDLDVELRIARSSSLRTVRTWLDDVDVRQATLPVSCVEDPRVLGTNVAWTVRGTSGRAFIVFVAGGLLPGGVVLPGVDGVLFLHPDLSMPFVGGAIAANGARTIQVSLPNDPRLHGVPLWFQGVELDPVAQRGSVGMLQVFRLIR